MNSPLWLKVFLFIGALCLLACLIPFWLHPPIIYIPASVFGLSVLTAVIWGRVKKDDTTK